MRIRCSLALLLSGLVLHAQGPVAPKAGLIYLAEGAVLLNGEPLDPGEGQLLFVEEGGTIRTGVGRAELLVGTSNYLRLAENTAVRMLSSDLSEVELQLQSGTVILEIVSSDPDKPVTLQCASSKVATARRGIYRLEHAAAKLLKVFDGRIQVETTADNNLLTRGWMMDLATGPAGSEPRKFQRRQKDGFDLWSADRSAQLARMRRAGRRDTTTLGGELQPLYSPQTSPRPKRFPDGSN